MPRIRFNHSCSRPPHSVLIGRMAGTATLASILMMLPACGDDAPPAKEPETVEKIAPTSTPADTGRRGYEIPIPQLEYWDPQRTTLKYTYEMRFDPPGPGENGPRLHRNGWARAFYGSGVLEREGAYRYNSEKGESERVGTWTYYETDGSVSRIEERGGDAIWTGPDQRIAPR
ncbi:MAG: hypothetical protein CMJ34_08650 [Phycisphaerae bacterium]|nr:hypothetical protein [Phycisphaerae bacterium]